MLPRKNQSQFVGVSGILARLWFQILTDLNVQPEYLRGRISEYVQRSNKTGESRTAKREYASNISSQLANAKMTFRNFYRGLAIIGILKCELSIKLHYKRAAPTVHSIEFLVSKDTDDEADLSQGDDSGEPPR